MNLLRDINKLENISKTIKNVRTPEDLLSIIQDCKDVFGSNIYELKGYMCKIERWEETIKDLTGLSLNSNFPDLAKNEFFKEAKSNVESLIKKSNGTLTNVLKNNQTLIKSKNDISNSVFSIGGVKVDYIFNYTLDYTTDTISQRIVSTQNVDRLNEDAENQNLKFSADIWLSGDDRNNRYNSLLKLRENKSIVKVIFNEVFNNVIITKISIKFDRKNTLILNMSFEDLFIATLKKSSTSLLNVVKATTNKGTQGTSLVDKNISALGIYQGGLVE